MSEVYVEYAKLPNIGNKCKAAATSIQDIRGDLRHTISRLDWDVKSQEKINQTANSIARKLEGCSSALTKYQSFLNSAKERYQKLDTDTSKWDTFGKELKSNYGWKEILSGAGYISTAYNFVSGLKDVSSIKDVYDKVDDAVDFVKDASKTYKNYKKIGNAVGNKTAMTWWAKNILGLKKVTGASKASNVTTRFFNNLTNKTSPYHAQIADVADTFTGAKGVGKAVTAWAGVALNSVLNYISNKEEQANSGGTMSDGRVVAETVTETVVDTAITYGASIVVGAAASAVLGAAAPGVAVVALSGLAFAGINAGVKAMTGKSTTEFISDAILDTGEAVGKAVGNAVKSAGDTVANWFGKLNWKASSALS